MIWFPSPHYQLVAGELCSKSVGRRGVVLGTSEVEFKCLLVDQYKEVNAEDSSSGFRRDAWQFSPAKMRSLEKHVQSAFQGDHSVSDALPLRRRHPPPDCTNPDRVTHLQNLSGLVFAQLVMLIGEFTPALDDRGGLRVWLQLGSHCSKLVVGVGCSSW
jgi:hypothetical protein